MLEILLFSLISLFFIIPPLFVDGQFIQKIDFTLFSVDNLSHFLLAIFLVYFYRHYLNKNNINLKFIFKNFLFLVFSLFFVVITSNIVNLIAESFYNVENFIVSNSVFVNKPINFFDYLISIFNLIFAAFFEETIYRFYVPVFLTSYLILNNPKIHGIPKLIFRILIELFVLLIFAFSHRYLGIFSVINAAIAHLIFRLTLIFTNNIFTSTTAHFIYNFYSLLCY